MAGVGAQASARETAELTMKAKAEDKITIYGPKSDGTYIVEFRTAAGEAAGRGPSRNRGTRRLCALSAESQVCTGLSAGGKGIRTRSPPRSGVRIATSA